MNVITIQLKRKLGPAIVLCLTIVSLVTIFGHGANGQLNDPKPESSRSPVLISSERFNGQVHQLRLTLSGNLATVWRSEWKTKLTISKSNNLVRDFVSAFLSPAAASRVLDSLDLNGEGFTREVHARLFALQSEARQNQQQYGENLSVRDRPPPVGVIDYTFTYYTNSIRDATTGSEGKHQIRIRGYLREIVFELLELNENIEAFLSDGTAVTLKRTAANSFSVSHAKTGTHFSSLKAMKEEFGDPGFFYAPHGANFKLEVKTALTDKIVSPEFTELNGAHMVQKVDVSLSPAQVSWLFAPLAEHTGEQKKAKSMERALNLSTEIIRESPELEPRVNAVFDVLATGIEGDPDFLKIIGATLYHRSAFEASGAQMTVDRQQAVFQQSMYNPESLKNPVEVLRTSDAISTLKEDARHVELKLPVDAVAKLLGLQFTDAGVRRLIPIRDLLWAGLLKAVKIFAPSVRDEQHPGKFNYLRTHGDHPSQPHHYVPLMPLKCSHRLGNL